MQSLIFADVPDVDVIRVGNDYYMVSTTAHMSPGAPIMHSKDLVNWRIISYVFDTLDESPKNNLEGGNIYSRGQWASSLRYHDETFYVFFGTGNKSYLYATKDPAGKWEKKAENRLKKACFGLEVLLIHIPFYKNWIGM